MRHTLFVAFLAALVIFGAPLVASAQGVRIDRPTDGGVVETSIEVAGVATPGRTVEVYVGDTRVADTIAEPDGWYVVRIDRPATASNKSTISVHELDEQGGRASTASISVTWSNVPVAAAPVPPPPDGTAPEPGLVAEEATAENSVEGSDQTTVATEVDDFSKTDRPRTNCRGVSSRRRWWNGGCAHGSADRLGRWQQRKFGARGRAGTSWRHLRWDGLGRWCVLHRPRAGRKREIPLDQHWRPVRVVHSRNQRTRCARSTRRLVATRWAGRVCDAGSRVRVELAPRCDANGVCGIRRNANVRNVVTLVMRARVSWTFSPRSGEMTA